MFSEATGSFPVLWRRKGQKQDLFLIVITHWVEMKPLWLISWKLKPGSLAVPSSELCLGLFFFFFLAVLFFFFFFYMVFLHLRLVFEASVMSIAHFWVATCFKRISTQRMLEMVSSKIIILRSKCLVAGKSRSSMYSDTGNFKLVYDPSNCTIVIKFLKAWAKLEMPWCVRKERIPV